jgi:hypothetical protein
VRRLWLAVALLAGCGGAPIPETDLFLSIEPHALEVAPGEPFPLTVTRVWRNDLEPDAWNDRALAPLALRLVEAVRRDDGTRTEETRRYMAHAFSLRDVVVPPVKLTAKERKVTATGFRIRVRPALDPEDPGPPELPGEPPPSRGWMWWGFGALLALAALVALRRKPRTAPPPPPPEPPPPPRALPLDRLKGASVEEAAEIVREHAAEARGVRALEMTTEEIVARLPALAAVLPMADLAKFAARPPTAAERDAVLAAAEAFLKEEPR